MSKTSATPAALGRESRICIVGAGPSGITAALEYRKLGYDQVVLLEQQNRVGGRCLTTEDGNDMGATAWIPGYFRDVVAFTDGLGIERGWVPRLTAMSSTTGGVVSQLSRGDTLRAYVQAVRYMLEWRRWSGVRGPGFGEVSDQLRPMWSRFMRERGYCQFSTHISVPVVGFGYRDMPAVYSVRAVSPDAILGSMKSLLRGGQTLGRWKGGTEQIWRRAIDRHGLDVRLDSHIETITREGDVKVQLRGSTAPLVFDYLVIACNPRPLLSVLDADPREHSLFSQIETFDYRTYECRVPGFRQGESFYGAFVDNLDETGVNRPAIVYKAEPNSELVVVYVNADGADDETIEGNIRADLAAVGAKLTEVKTRCRFDYSPHVGTAALEDDFFVKLGGLQGHRRTLGVGAAYTFDGLGHVMEQARATVQSHAAGKLSS